MNELLALLTALAGLYSMVMGLTITVTSANKIAGGIVFKVLPTLFGMASITYAMKGLGV